MAVVELIYDVKPYSYITSNPTKILSNGEPIYLSDGRYGFGDGITTLSSLPLYGGSGYAFTGLTSQYTRGDGTYATFPTNVSSFTNDSGYITSSALSPYLTIANAALTYQPIGSYLTGLTVGSTAIGSGTNTRILYNNAGVLGEYAVTGTGTTAVLSTSPTISTSLTISTGSTTTVIRDLVGTPTSSAIYFNQATPSATNYALKGTHNQTALNAVQDVLIKVADATKFNIDTVSTVFNQTTTNSGAITPFSWTMGNNTNQTASTEITNYKFNGSTKTWLAGGITNQRWAYFTANTAAFASASTITNSYSLYVEAAVAGTNATITNNYAAGFGGAIQVTNNTTATDDFVGAVTGSKRLRLWNTTSSTTSLTQLDVQNNGSTLSSLGVTSGSYTGTGVLTSNTHFFIAQNGTVGNNVLYGANSVAMRIKFINGGFATTNVAFEIDNNNNVICGNAALATNATNGFLYVPTCAGTPTGVPTTVTGRIPIVADSTNNKLYMYSGGAWVAVN